MDVSIIVGENSKGTKKRKKADDSLEVLKKTKGLKMAKTSLKMKTKRQIESEKRYEDKNPELEGFQNPCNHQNKKFLCNQLTLKNLVTARKKIYSTPVKIQQDKRLSHLMCVTEPKRRSKNIQDSPKRPNNITVKYFIRIKMKKVNVCAKLFKAAFSVGTRRLNTIAKFIQTGSAIEERRGGNRKKLLFQDKRKKVMEFISSLKVTESHYGGDKTKRHYLPSDCNKTKLWKMYNSTVPEPLQVKKWFFKQIFYTNFNIGIGSPATDQCSYCSKTKAMITCEKDNYNKTKMMSELGAHRLRAKTFYKIMKSEPYGSTSICMALAFYARQISLYSLCITDVQNKNPIIYSWTENQGKKGANEVSSALYNYLINKTFNPTTNNLRVFADGCSGQNKNAHIIHVLAMWLLKDSPDYITDVLMVFPVRGHSYLPADRVLGHIQQELKLQSEIADLTQCSKVYSACKEVRVLGEHWQMRDMKTLSQDLKKTEGISDMKRIFLKKMAIDGMPTVAFKMEPTYCAEDANKEYTTLLKTGKNYFNVQIPEPIPFLNQTSSERVDFLKLLNVRFGDSWKNQEQLCFYDFLLNKSNEDVSNEQGECNCLDEEPGMNSL